MMFGRLFSLYLIPIMVNHWQKVSHSAEKEADKYAISWDWLELKVLVLYSGSVFFSCPQQIHLTEPMSSQ